MRICHRQKFPARFSGFPGVTLPALPVSCHPVVGSGGAFAPDEEWLPFFRDFTVEHRQKKSNKSPFAKINPREILS